MMDATPHPDEIDRQVRAALREDIGTGDLTANLVPDGEYAKATLVSRESAVVCGNPWIEGVFRILDPRVSIDFHRADTDEIAAGDTWCVISGPARSILTGERSALNFAQLLSGTATATRAMVRAIAGTKAVLLDTRKTIPGLRLAQKYAVRCGGASNHRIGLYDGILIKENHIRAAGSIGAAVNAALTHSKKCKFIEVEVENLDELKEALAAGAPRILLDNFSLDEMRAAVALTNGQAQLEASGGVTIDSIREIAATGVDFVSCGQITKDVRATDLSLQFAFGSKASNH
jgi:nicotinate-nucleotide pyrophosphorylase (carboxylating)